MRSRRGGGRQKNSNSNQGRPNFNSRWFDHRVFYQVIPGHRNPQKRRTMFGSYLFKYNNIALNTRLFTRYVRKHPSKNINTIKLLEKFLDASERHKTSTNSSVRDYFRQFSDWWETYFGHSQESPGSLTTSCRLMSLFIRSTTNAQQHSSPFPQLFHIKSTYFQVGLSL